MFRFMIAAFVAAALSPCAQAAESKEPKIDPAVVAKTGTASAIAQAIAETGTVRVLVVVKPTSGASVEDLSAQAHVAATRAAVKSQVKAALDTVLSTHTLSHVSDAKGAPALIRLTTTPAFSALVDEAELVALAKDPRVVSIQYDLPMKKHLAVTVPFIGMPAVHAAGGTGAGTTVAVIDDGVQRKHIFLGLSRLHSGREACFLATNDCPDGSNEQIGSGASAAAAGASHGTHVAGIALGRNSGTTPNKGVAPRAKLVPINIFGPSTGTSFATIQRAYEHVEDLVLESGGSNPLNIASINMSVGGPDSDGNNSKGDCDENSAMALLKPVIDSLHKKGVVSAVSAGNDGETGKMSFPACLSSIFSVAATSRAGVTASYTNISPTTDVFAPGGEVGGDCVISSVPTDDFGAKCGTSMASPHVAGAVAALRSAVPSATACRIEDALVRTGVATPDLRANGTISKSLISVNQARSRLLKPVAARNDKFSAASTLPSNATDFLVWSSNVATTTEPGEPSFVGTGNARSLWWKWTPNASGPVVIDTLGSGLDTVLAVFRGATSVTRLGTRVVRNDNASSTVKQSRVEFDAVAGTTYHIVVAGRSPSEECTLQLSLKRPPVNDNFARATVVTVPVVTEVNLSGSNVRSTFETGEPAPDGNASSNSTVWFRFTALETKVITLDSFGSAIDTVLSVYKGSTLGALTPIVVNDDSGGTRQSRVSFQMKTGATYFVQLAGFKGAQGRYRMSFSPANAQSVETVKASLSE